MTDSPLVEDPQTAQENGTTTTTTTATTSSTSSTATTATATTGTIAEQEQEQEQEESTPKKDYSQLIQQALDYKQVGNKLFNEAKYSEAIEQYTKAITIMEGGHKEYAQECSIFYGNRAACYVSLGHHIDVINDCTSSLSLVPSYTKALLRRAVAYEADNQLQKALSDFDELNKIDPTLKVAVEAKARLPPLVKIQQEKEAAEMIAKLKDLGNSILGKFGLSTDNFQFTKDPTSGGYSINMKK